MFPALIILISLLYAFLAWRDLRLGLFLIAAALPSYLIRFSVFGLPLTLLEILILILFLAWLFKKPDLAFLKKYQKLFWPISLLLIAATVGILVAPDKIAALGIWKSYFLEPLLLFIIALDQLKEKKDLTCLITYLGIGALFIAVFAIFQRITLWAIPAPWNAEGRVVSIFPYPNAVGLYLGPITVLGFFALINNLKNKKLAVFWSIALIVSALAIIFAQTEAAYLAVPTAIVLGCIFFTKYRWPVLIASLIAIALIGVIPTARQTVWQKISFQDYSGTVRLVQWDETWQMLRDQPIFGAGLSGYPQGLAPYHTHQDIEIFQYPHNLIFNAWTELGLLGLLASLLLLWVVIRRLKPKTLSQNWLALASAAALTEMIIHGLVDVPYLKNDLAILTWLIVALLLLSTRSDQ